MINVLLTYDSRTRLKYWDYIKAIIADAGGIAVEVDAGAGSYDIAEQFDKSAQDADVILIDLTHPNTNIGYEIGRYMRRRDQRLIAFYFEPNKEPGKALPFYLKHTNCRPLYAVPSGSDKGRNQRKELIEDIKTIGSRTYCNPITPYKRDPENDKAARLMFEKCEAVYRAPGAAFIFGEFAVTVGHPALHLPIPRYVYVGISKQSKGEATRIRYVRPNAKSLEECDEIEEQYGKMLDTTLAILGSEALDILVWTQVPTMCGLGTSSAISACLTLYLTGLENAAQVFSAKEGRKIRNVLKRGTEAESTFKLAWKIDASFHSYLGSGAGVCASMLGTSGANPILYFSESRRMWKGDLGSYPWELGEWRPSAKQIQIAHVRIDSIHCFAFPLTATEGGFKKGHFALVYSGHPKSTGSAMERINSIGSYFLDRAQMVDELVKSIRSGEYLFRYPLSQRASRHYSSLIRSAMNRGPSVKKIQNEHRLALREIFMSSYGCSALSGINSYWSKDDYSFLSLMVSCQTVLESLGLAEIQTKKGEVSHEPAQLAASISRMRNSMGERLFGAKITGGGRGGDIIVYSQLEDPKEFERMLRYALGEAKDSIDTKFSEFGDVHFSSSWVDDYPLKYYVEPAKALSRK